MKVTKILAILFAINSFFSASAAFAGVTDILEEANIDTTQCKLVSKPNNGKLINKKFVINKKQGTTAQVYQLNNEQNYLSWFYVIKDKNQKVTTNVYTFYQNSGNKTKNWDLLLGTCGGNRNQTVTITDKKSVNQAVFKLGSFRLTKPRWTTIPLTSTPNYTDTSIK
jgi:hypothetical protein